MSEELKPCPFCGEKIEPPKSRQASTDRSEGFVAFAACYCGGYSATAHKMGRGNTEAEAIREVIALWNRRAQPAEAEGVEVVAYGMPNSAPGKAPRMMMVAIDIPGDDQYGGQLWEPLVRQSALSAVTAERDRLRDAAGKAIAWLDAEQNGSGVGINRRLKLCRDAENSLRAAIAAKEA